MFELLTEKKFFDINEFKAADLVKQRWMLATKGLKLGEGSSREVYAADNKRVVKLAKGAKGRAQNKAELDAYTNLSLVPVFAEVYDSAPDFTWIESEITRQLNSDEEFKKLLGLSPVELKEELLEWEWDEEHADFDKTLFSDLTRLIIHLRDDANMEVGDLIKVNSWGKTPEGRAVLLDYGFTEDVRLGHYSKNRKAKQDSVETK